MLTMAPWSPMTGSHTVGGGGGGGGGDGGVGRKKN